MSALGVSTATTDIQQCESAACYPRDTGPRPPLLVALMENGQEQADDEGNAPEQDPDLEHSGGVAGEGLGFVGAHLANSMRP